MNKRTKRKVRFILILTAIIFSLVYYSTNANSKKGTTYTEYTVVQDDTLWNIAKSINSNEDPRELVFHILKINDMNDTDIIRPGQKIIIPAKLVAGGI